MKKHTEPEQSEFDRLNEAFFNFKGMLENAPVEHFTEVAELLGISRNTIYQWMKANPKEMGISKMKGIVRALQKMEQAGENDWRMWEKKLALLGLKERKELDVTSGGEQIQVMITSYSDILKDSTEDTIS